MIEESDPPRLSQPTLFTLEESIGNVELFPAVWSAAEDLVIPDGEMRRQGLDRLLALNAPRFSALVVYLLATRISDPDLSIRTKIVQTLAAVLSPDDNGHPAPENVRNTLTTYLAQMRQRPVFCLLEALLFDPSLEWYVTRLLDGCPYAGTHLVDILADRRVSFAIRERAAQAIGWVGYLDTLPALERLASRLEARLNGQQTMPFAPPATPDEVDLLPAIRSTLALLRAP